MWSLEDTIVVAIMATFLAWMLWGIGIGLSFFYKALRIRHRWKTGRLTQADIAEVQRFMRTRRVR
jgi:hypothetical protein